MVVFCYNTPSHLNNIILCGMWTIWAARNNRRHGAKGWDTNHVARSVQEVAREVACMANVRQADPTKQDVPEGWHKVNVDGSFQALTSEGGSGVVIRDDHGAFLGLKPMRVVMESDLHKSPDS